MVDRLILHRMLIATLALSLVLSTSGCGVKNPLSGFSLFRPDMSVHAPYPLVDQESFEAVDLVQALVSEQCEPDDTTCKSPQEVDALKMALGNAFKAFYEDPVDQAARRNRIQDRILAASDQRCAEYKGFLNQFDSSANFTLGSLTTIAAGAGSIFTAASTVRALSGAAAILSGVRAELNEDYFFTKTVQVITAGIESRRGEIRSDLTLKRSKHANDYTVQAAIGDAVRYHGACTLIIGLEEAASSAERAQDPGVRTAAIALANTKRLQYIMNADQKDLFPAGLLGPAAAQTNWLGLGSASLGSTSSQSGVGAFESTNSGLLTLARQSSSIEGVITKLKEDEQFKNDAAKKKSLDEIATAAGQARDQAKKLLAGSLRKSAVDQDAKINDAYVALVQAKTELDRYKKAAALAKEQAGGNLIQAEVLEVTAPTNAVIEILENKEKTADEKVTGASKAIATALNGLMNKRSAATKKAVKALTKGDAIEKKILSALPATVTVSPKNKDGIVKAIEGAEKSLKAAVDASPLKLKDVSDKAKELDPIIDKIDPILAAG